MSSKAIWSIFAAKIIIFKFIYPCFQKKENSQGQNSLVDRAIQTVEGFADFYYRFSRNLSIEGRSKKTLMGYGRHIAAISLHYGRIPLKLTAEEVKDYLYELQNRSKTSSESYFKHTVYGLRYLLKSESLPYSHLQLPAIKKDKKLPVVLSKEEAWRMLFSLESHKDRILIGFIYGCGLRNAEVCNVRLQDVDFDREILHVVQGKGGKDRYVPLSKHLIRGLKIYIESEKPQEWLFHRKSIKRNGKYVEISQHSHGSILWIVKKAAKQAKIRKNVNTHTLRHTFATHLIEDGLDIVSIKELLGHVCIATTMEYLHVTRINPKRAFSPLDTLFEQCAKKQN